MPKQRSPIADYAVYLIIRVVVALAQMFSVREGYRLADGLAALMYRVDKRHRRVALENLEQAFGPELGSAQRDRLVREVYRHFCRMIIEMLHIPRKLRLTTWRRYIRLAGHEAIITRVLDGGPTILLTGHYGNWEMAGYVFGVFGIPPYSVARTLDNPYLDRFIRSFRERTGQRLIAKKGGSEEMVRVLERGGTLSFLADQDAGPKGLFVEFFGRPASTFKAIALLAMEHDAPVFVGGARRLGSGFRYEVRCECMLRPADYGADLRGFTQDYTRGLERAIRRDPAQYLWLHRRWKNQPKVKNRTAEQAGGTAPGAIPPPHLGTPAHAAERDARRLSDPNA
jgi:KDO2-lipid IV(A) lauroyltransferase